MATVPDQDRFFQGQLEASTPEHLIGEGVIQRLINGRFVEGAISNAIGFDELEFEFIPKATVENDGTRPFTSKLTHEQLLSLGDVQVVAPMDNIAGQFLICVISGSLYKFDLENLTVTEITPRDAYLPDDSSQSTLSFTDNDGGTLGVGGYLVIFNYPNKSIIINDIEARLANATNYEVPPSRLGATAGSRMFIASGDNLVYASDPLGGASSLAPLTFEETLNPDASYYSQVFTIGSVLDTEHITAVCRMPRYLVSAQDFIAQQLLVSTKNKKYILSASAARDTWGDIQFISYAGSTPGVAGPQACTSVGDVIFYISNTGRIKTVGQDKERDTGLSEVFMDESLGQYLCHCENSFFYKKWYQTLDHSRSIMKFSNDRLYATVYPMSVPALGKLGEHISSPTHRALAVGSIASETRLGQTASIAWEGFYDWLQPIGMATVGDKLYIVSKDYYGRLRFYRENSVKVDDHVTTVYTRGYLSEASGHSRSVLEGSLYFRKLDGPVNVKISVLVNGEWICGSNCKVSTKLHRFKLVRDKSDGFSIPLKIDIDHNACAFELMSIRVAGEVHRQER